MQKKRKADFKTIFSVIGILLSLSLLLFYGKAYLIHLPKLGVGVFVASLLLLRPAKTQHTLTTNLKTNLHPIKLFTLATLLYLSFVLYIFSVVYLLTQIAPIPKEIHTLTTPKLVSAILHDVLYLQPWLLIGLMGMAIAYTYYEKKHTPTFFNILQAFCKQEISGVQKKLIRIFSIISANISLVLLMALFVLFTANYLGKTLHLETIMGLRVVTFLMVGLVMTLFLSKPSLDWIRWLSGKQWPVLVIYAIYLLAAIIFIVGFSWIIQLGYNHIPESLPPDVRINFPLTDWEWIFRIFTWSLLLLGSYLTASLAAKLFANLPSRQQVFFWGCLLPSIVISIIIASSFTWVSKIEPELLAVLVNLFYFVVSCIVLITLLKRKNTSAFELGFINSNNPAYRSRYRLHRNYLFLFVGILALILFNGVMQIYKFLFIGLVSTPLISLLTLCKCIRTTNTYKRISTDN
jgi:hypothetical protein